LTQQVRLPQVPNQFPVNFALNAEAPLAIFQGNVIDVEAHGVIIGNPNLRKLPLIARTFEAIP
jgi:hypothetical protein